MKRFLAGLVVLLAFASPSWAGHNEFSLIRKQGAAVCNYANYAESHTGALISKFSPIFDSCRRIELKVSQCNAAQAQTWCSSITGLGSAYAHAVAHAGSCGGSYARFGLAYAAPERRDAASTTAPDGVDTVGVTLVSVAPDSRSFTVDVTASLQASTTIYATDTLAFFAYRDTFAFRNDTRHLGVNAIAGGIVILHSPEGVLEFPAVNGGNLFTSTTLVQPAHEFSLHRQFAIADTDSVVVLSTYGGGSGNAAVPAATPFTMVVLVGVLAVVGCLGIMRQRHQAR